MVFGKVITLFRQIFKAAQKIMAAFLLPPPSTAPIPQSPEDTLQQTTAPSLLPPLSMANIPQTPNEISHKVLQPFNGLPYELRLKIWKFYLDETPQLYRFELSYPTGGGYFPHPRTIARPDDYLFIEPVLCMQSNAQTPESADERFLQPFRDMVKRRRTASMTCRDSRQTVLDTLPDTLNFRLHSGWKPAKREYTLRFNGARDIFIFDTCWEDLDMAAQIIKLRGFPPDGFTKMQHVGLAVNHLRSCCVRYRHGRPTYGTWKCEDNCATEACRDHCQLDPLPTFLSTFPLLEKFYIAGVPTSSTHKLGDRLEAGRQPPVYANCPCPIGYRHAWPLIRSRQACGWFLIYDESSSCPFPKFSRVEDLRQRWRSHFPYYDALNHLEIRFIQLVQSNCKDCLYKW